MSKKKAAPAAHKAVAQLDSPLHRHSGEELVQVNRQQMDRIKLAVDYPTTPAVQTAVGNLSTSTDALEKTMSALEQKKAEVATMTQTRDTQTGDVMRDRDALRVSVNVAAKGSPDAIKAWNCFVAAKQPAPATTEPPELLTVKNSPTTPGNVLARCKAVKGAGSYLFVFTTDPNALPGVGQTVSSTKARCEVTGQTTGHVLYARVAVTRKGGGLSGWSAPSQILVR